LLFVVDDLEVAYCVVDRHRGEVQQTLDRMSDLLVLLEDAAEEILDSSLLVVGVIASAPEC
jgi:hypothetical protein